MLHGEERRKAVIKENLEEVEQRIQAACRRAGRKREEVTLIAVSKTKPVEDLKEAYQLGIRTFGENKVQELTEKYEVLPKDIHWHMIGHLQTNKVKYIVDKAELIHSVDSLKLAETIEKEAAKKNCIVSILIEVNVAPAHRKNLPVSACPDPGIDDNCTFCSKFRRKSNNFQDFTKIIC